MKVENKYKNNIDADIIFIFIKRFEEMYSNIWIHSMYLVKT